MVPHPQRILALFSGLPAFCGSPDPPKPLFRAEQTADLAEEIAGIADSDLSLDTGDDGVDLIVGEVDPKESLNGLRGILLEALKKLWVGLNFSYDFLNLCGDIHTLSSLIPRLFTAARLYNSTRGIP